MSDIDYSEVARSKTTPELIAWISGWREGSHPRLAGEFELQKRKSRAGEVRGWIAIGLSTVSLVVAIFAYFKK